MNININTPSLTGIIGACITILIGGNALFLKFGAKELLSVENNLLIKIVTLTQYFGVWIIIVLFVIFLAIMTFLTIKSSIPIKENPDGGV